MEKGKRTFHDRTVIEKEKSTMKYSPYFLFIIAFPVFILLLILVNGLQTFRGMRLPNYILQYMLTGKPFPEDKDFPVVGHCLDETYCPEAEKKYPSDFNIESFCFSYSCQFRSCE
ncbi:uncharacterized protein LOC128249863 isoform X2 [Octopus bimaculoides]|uniref:uncharacterized protein LOC128249863 isoform X2 n=1 Tax=Octopus bimaculoides TaxID=37653 RepID=UPI0022E7E2A4|nr:uncharacterized protein LOC128249863 isoform X2 [Octopus bimaculoides]